MPLIYSKSSASPSYLGKSQSPFSDLWDLVSWYLFDLFSCYPSYRLLHSTSFNILTRHVPLSGSSHLHFLYSEIFFSQISSWLTTSFPSGMCSKACWWTDVFLGTLSNMAISTSVYSHHFPSHFPLISSPENHLVLSSAPLGQKRHKRHRFLSD